MIRFRLHTLGLEGGCPLFSAPLTSAEQREDDRILIMSFCWTTFDEPEIKKENTLPLALIGEKNNRYPSRDHHSAKACKCFFAFRVRIIIPAKSTSIQMNFSTDLLEYRCNTLRDSASFTNLKKSSREDRIRRKSSQRCSSRGRIATRSSYSFFTFLKS